MIDKLCKITKRMRKIIFRKINTIEIRKDSSKKRVEKDNNFDVNVQEKGGNLVIKDPYCGKEWRADKDLNWGIYCPDCGREFILKDGEIKIKGGLGNKN